MPVDAPSYVIAHLSDTHLLAGGAPLHGVDTVRNLERALARLESTRLRIDAIVHTGDIADLGERDAYDRVRALVDPVAERLGCPVVWVAGNHDLRGPLRAGLLGGTGDEPLDAVYEVRGVRIVTLDTSVPGHGYGELGSDQLDWVADVLSTPAPQGTVLALHHPPVPTVVGELQKLQLRQPERLAAIVAASDVRAVLAGHFHYGTAGLFGGVPVHVATATSYTIRPEAPALGLTGVDGGQGLALLHLFADGRAVHVPLALDDHAEVVHLPDGYFDTHPV